MSESPDSTCNPPTAATFSFSAPFPGLSSSNSPTSSSSSTALKQRRVSLALPSSPRVVQAWNFRDDTGLTSHVAETSAPMPERKGKMRKIADDGDRHETTSSFIIQHKKPRKKWSEEETRMLVEGCNTWGVGNWKAILKDPKLKFDNRSPVDLKDRFRTYFPDAYKEHYPNAKTHLSSKVRSTLPDGRSIFEKTRSKKRRPFTEEEDRALKAGYEKHGTVWATIVKDPVFQEQNRRSTDLRDRFRNAFPELYQAAGYKPRNAPKKRRECVPPLPIRSATDDQFTAHSSYTDPGHRKRVQSRQGVFRGGRKSVPESTTCSEEDESSAGEEEGGTRLFRCPPIVHDTSHPDETSSPDGLAEMDMETIDPLSEPLSIPDFMPSASHSLSELTDSSQSQTWSSIDTPLNSATWSATAASPTSSHLSSDYLLGHSPFDRRMNTIGKSAWGTQDWFSANPRLDNSAFSSSGSSFAEGLSPAPSSPFSFHNLNHGVVDRYDLFPSSFPSDFTSDIGVGDSHSTFSDPEMFAPSSFRGFTHHSNYAGDLIFGARTHQPQQTYYGAGFGFGTPGLGLSGMQQATALHPLQLHTAALPGIDEIELASITLNDQAEISGEAISEVGMQKDDPETSLNVSTLDMYTIARHNMDDLVDLTHSTPPATPITTTRSLRGHPHMHSSSNHGRSISVPPSEYRGTSSHPSQGHGASQPQISSTRSLPFFDALLHSHADLAPMHTQPSTPSVTDLWRPSHPNDPHGVPYLDLHYFSSHATDGHGHGHGHDVNHNHMTIDTSRQGQALDLARSHPSQKSAPPVPFSTLSQALQIQTAQALLASTSSRQPHATHQRGMSFVSPQDLQLRKVNDNKRKRASWDGGAF
ncbi:WSC protein [Rhizopogon vesiculosus]|uniref:WSC protein n=1 Tax=Rhizopogon vesiculosus TaxID=180088 RepID=A0A1J8QZH0_9AGAM|nr:WSC protein [Rhizopogon vesiculosus]